jgi:hypothetical protein
MFMRTAIAAAILLILCASAKTQDFSAYKCTIKETMELGKEGPVPKDPAIADLAYRNSEFVVDRESGKMVGGRYGGFGGATQYSVLHPGNSGAAFKAVYTSEWRPVLYLLTLSILENERGAVKPFLLTEVADLVNMHFGTCTHLN